MNTEKSNSKDEDNKNPLPLLIPCHRVIKSDGTLGNYSAGGPSVKKVYLTLEKAILK